MPGGEDDQEARWRAYFREESADTPKMPCVTAPQQTHRCKAGPAAFNACVARPVYPKEVKTNPKAKAALDAEWHRLRHVPRKDGTRGVWDEHRVREWPAVKADAQAKGETAHVARVFGLVVEKNHELPEDDPKRKYKGRAVVGGDNMRDETGNYALFQDLGSCPATMEAARAADAYGCLDGHDIQQCDAEQAYTQAELSGTPTWVRLPRDQWPASWAGMKDPVCPLVLALYGHPDSGGHWEAHCEKHLRAVGYEPIPAWRSCFWHPRLRLFLVVYVDDFKLSGPSKNLKEGWELIRRSIRTDEPHSPGLFLGCKHNVFEKTLPECGTKVRGMGYDMEDFLRSCVDRYRELTGVTVLRKAVTPFLPEPTRPDFSTAETDVVDEPAPDEALRRVIYGEPPSGDHVSASEAPNQKPHGEPSSEGHALAGGALEGNLQEGVVDDKNVPTQLAPYAAKVLMKILYAARFARLDLLRAVCVLAQRATK